jgi:hypothetical protein
MPLTLTELIIGIAIIVGVPAVTIALNRRKRPLGWVFLVVVILFFVVGNLIEMTLR